MPLDAVTGAKFLREQLRQYDNSFYATEYPEYWGAEGRHHYATGDLALGVREIISGRMDYVGEAVIYGPEATDIPLADFGITEDKYKTRIVIAAAEFNIFELATQQAANQNPMFGQRNIIAEKMDALKLSIDRKMHKLVVYGDTAHQMDGLFSGADVEVKTLTENLYALSADDLYDWWLNELGVLRRETLLTADFMQAMVPDAMRTKMMRRFPTNGDGNPLTLLTGQNGNALSLQSMESVNELDSRFLEDNGVHEEGDDLDRMVLGSLGDSRAMRRQFYTMDRTAPHTADGLTFKVFGYAATSEAQFRQPYKFRYYEFPKAA